MAKAEEGFIAEDAMGSRPCSLGSFVCDLREISVSVATVPRWRSRLEQIEEKVEKQFLRC